MWRLLALSAAASAYAGTWQHLGPDGHLHCLLEDPLDGFPVWGSNDCLYNEDGSWTDGSSPSTYVRDAQAASILEWYATGDAG